MESCNHQVQSDVRQHWKGKTGAVYRTRLPISIHDIDDAVRGGILKEEDLPSEYTDILGHSSKARLNRMVHDVITQSMDRPEIHMSDEVWKAMRGLRQYLFEHGIPESGGKGRRGEGDAYDYESLSYLYGKTGTHAGAVFEYAGKWRRVKRTDSV